MAHLESLRLSPAVEAAGMTPKGFSALTVPEKRVLNLLRVQALRCRASARAELFDACATLANAAQVDDGAYAKTLIRCLTEALGEAPVLYRPNVEEISFDEAWLLRAINASQYDRGSFEFLIRSRVRKIAQRSLGALVSGMARHSSLT